MNFVKKSAKRALSIMLVLALVMGSAFTGGLFANWEGAAYAGSYPTATVTITSTGGGAFLHDPVTKAVSANLAESYGYTDGIPATQGVSLVDVLVQANIEVYGEAAFAEAPTSYLALSGGFATNIFGLGSNANININGVQASDGIMNETYHTYTGLAYTDTPIYTGDLVEITMYQDSYWLDKGTYFEYEGNRVNHLNVVKGVPGSLTLKSVSLLMGMNTREQIASQTEGLGYTEIYAYGDSSTPLSTTDGTGRAYLTFDTEGEYTLIIPGCDDEDDPSEYYSQPCLVVNVVDGELSDQQKAENEAQFLSWDDIRNANDSTYNVSSDLTLPKTQGDATISWASSKTAVITNTGKVTPDCYDNYVVTLTATVKVGNSTVKKPFTLQVYKDTDESHRPVAIMTAEEQKAKIAEVVAALTNEKIVALDSNLMLNRDVLAAYLSQGGELTANQKTAVLKQVQVDILAFEANKISTTWSSLLKDALVLCAMGIDPRQVNVEGNTINLLEKIYTAPTSCNDAYKAPYALMVYAANDAFEIPSDASLSKDYLLNFLITNQGADGALPSGQWASVGNTASIVLGLVKYTDYSSDAVAAGAVTTCIEKAKEYVDSNMPGSGAFSVPDDDAFVIMFYAMAGEDPASAQKGAEGYPDAIDGLFSFYRGNGNGFSNNAKTLAYQGKATSEGFRACAVMNNFYDNDASTSANIYDFSGKTLTVETAWPESKNLESITVENTKDTYYKGEPGRPEYTTVTAIYSDGTSEVVHSHGQKNNNPDLVFAKAPTTAGSKTIKVTYSETIDGIKVSKDTTFPVNVIENPASAKIKVYVTLANQGVLAKDKNGKEIAQTEVNVQDQNYNGIYDIDDVLYYADSALCKGTSVEGYTSEEGQYGLGVTKLMGNTSGAYGYWKNNTSCWSLTDEVAANDFVTAFIYKDAAAWSDIYTAFSSNSYDVAVGNNVQVTLNGYAWNNELNGGYGDYEASPCAGAKLFILGTNNGDESTAVTDANGKYTLKFATAGTRYLVAYKADGSIVPAVTKIVVGGGGGSAPAPAVGDTVTFTLKGDTVHTGSLHKGTNYPTWIAKTTVELSSSVKTVGDVFKTVLDDKGYGYEGWENNYVKYIITPDGTELGEFTNGQNSGWLYSVNGEVPPIALNDYILEDGDDIIWYYTDDYTKDSGSKKYMDNTETPQPTPTPDTTVSESVETTATVKDGKAVAEVKAADVAKAIEKVGGEKADNKEVVLEIKGTNGADAIEAGIPAAAVKELDKADVDVAIKTEGGNVTIPADAMGNIAAQSGNNNLTVTMENKKPADAAAAAGGDENLAKEAGISSEALAGASITEVNMTAGGKNITSFGGSNIELYIPLKGNFVAGHSYRGAAISANGSIEGFIADCVKMAGQMFAKVKSGHLTTFVITNEEVKNPFTDVKSGDYFFQPVLWAVSKDVTGGVSETSFAPNAGCTRAQMVTFLWRAAGKPWASANRHFSDVAEGAYYKDAVEWAIAAGITNGVSETVFDPNGAVTREQLASFIYRYAQSKGQGFTGAWMFLLDYSDASKISSWADEAMHWCVMKEIVGGTGNKMLSPQGTATRGQIVTMLYRYFNL